MKFSGKKIKIPIIRILRGKTQIVSNFLFRVKKTTYQIYITRPLARHEYELVELYGQTSHRQTSFREARLCQL